MARYVIDNEAKNLSDIQSFTTDGYQYSEEHTQKASQPVFIR